MNHLNGVFINKHWIVHFVFSDYLPFLIVLNKRKKNKSMENCISKISKDRLLGLEEFMKNKTSFEKGKVTPGLDRPTRGTYTRIHSMIKYSRMLDPLQAGAWRRYLF